MYKFFKGLALFIPTIISFIMLKIVVLKLDGATTDIRILELKMDSIIGIIGVAVSVWIGLNIYNLVEKNEIEEKMNRYSKKYIDFETKINACIDKQDDKIKTSKDNLVLLKKELNSLSKIDCSLDISGESVNEIGEKRVYDTVSRIIETYCHDNPELIIFFNYNSFIISDKGEKYFRWDLKSNKSLCSEQGHIYNIRESILKNIPDLDITVGIFG